MQAEVGAMCLSQARKYFFVYVASHHSSLNSIHNIVVKNGLSNIVMLIFMVNK